jgi:hypothetical protein
VGIPATVACFGPELRLASPNPRWYLQTCHPCEGRERSTHKTMFRGNGKRVGATAASGGLEEAVQGSGVAVSLSVGPGSGERPGWPGQKRRFRAGMMERPALGGGGQEDWNNGTMEYWNDGLGDRPPSPVFQLSSIPSFHWSAGGVRLWAALPSFRPRKTSRTGVEGG